jgi:toxin ParE1/3/4
LPNFTATIAERASPEIAEHHVNAILRYCESMCTVAHRGMRRDDIRPGLRITHYKGRAIIAFAVEGEQVWILGVFYGGQDYENALRSEEDEE